MTENYRVVPSSAPHVITWERPEPTRFVLLRAPARDNSHQAAAQHGVSCLKPGGTEYATATDLAEAGYVSTQDELALIRAVAQLLADSPHKEALCTRLRQLAGALTKSYLTAPVAYALAEAAEAVSRETEQTADQV